MGIAAPRVSRDRGGGRRWAASGAWAALLVVAAVAAAVVVGVALMAGEARAATPTRATVEATTFTVQAWQSGEAFAVCPAGKRAVGGGVVQSGPTSWVKVLASGPLDGTGVTLETNDGDRARQWYAAVGNSSGQARTFRVYALCSGTSTATIEATSLTVDGNQTAEAFAKCPPGKRALGGGVVQRGTARYFYLGASGPLDATGSTSGTVTGDVARQWYGVVFNDHSDQVRTFKVIAICSADSAATVKATPLTVAGAGESVEAFARCAGTKRTLGGGLVQSGPAHEDILMHASGPLNATGVTLDTDDGEVARQWYAGVNNFSGSVREFKAFAICE